MTKGIKLSEDLALPLRAVTESIAILGRKGSGKTYSGQKLFEEMFSCGAQCVALDPVGNWWGLRLSSTGKRAGLDIPVFGGERGDIPITPEAGKLLAKTVVDRKISCVIDLMLFNKSERKRFVSAFAEELFNLKKRREQRSPLHLFIEEARKFIPQRYGPDEAHMIGAFEDIVRLGRNYGLGVSLLDQRPQSVNKEVLSQTEILICHQLTGKHERKEIEAWVRDNAADGSDALDQLDKLMPGEAFVWSPGLLRKFARVKVAKKSTYDASSTPELGGEADAVAPKPLSEKDLGALKEQMIEIVKAAETTDVKALQKKIVSLEVENKKLLAQAKRTVEVPTIIEKPVMPDLNGLRRSIDNEIGKALNEAFGGFVIKNRPPDSAKPRPVKRDPAYRTTGSGSGDRENQNGTLSGPEKRILNALAWFHSLGNEEPAQPAVAFLAGYTYGAGSFNNPKGSLRQKGYLEYLSGDRMKITEDGLALAEVPDLPTTSESLHAAVLARLPGPEQRLLKPLLEAYPAALSNEALAAAADYQCGAGSFNNPKGRLRTLGLIEYPEAGFAKAKELLFL